MARVFDIERFRVLAQKYRLEVVGLPPLQQPIPTRGPDPPQPGTLVAADRAGAHAGAVGNPGDA